MYVKQLLAKMAMPSPVNGAPTPRVPTVDPRPRPPPTAPGHFKQFQRVMGGDNPTLAESVVQNVMDTCRGVDHNARLVTMTKSTGGHIKLRVRAGDIHSVNSLQRALADAMPLSSTLVQESWVDGTLEAEVTVLPRDEEYRVARKLVASKRLFQYWIAFAWILICLGVAEWVTSVRVAWAPELLRDEL